LDGCGKSESCNVVKDQANCADPVTVQMSRNDEHGKSMTDYQVRKVRDGVKYHIELVKVKLL